MGGRIKNEKGSAKCQGYSQGQDERGKPAESISEHGERGTQPLQNLLVRRTKS